MRRAVLALALAACSSTPPGPPDAGDVVLTVTSPMPGDEIAGDEHAMITVTGTLATTGPDARSLELWVNGTSVPLDGGAFSVDIAPQPGINHIRVEGGDPVLPLASQELDVMWAPAYLPSRAGEAGFDLDDALDLRLGQAFFDARKFGTTLDLTTDPVVAHDIGAALELILHHIPLASLLPSHLTFGSGSAQLDVAIASATPAQILVDATIVQSPGAIDLSIDLNSVFLAMSGTFQLGSRTLVVAGGIAADMHATARLVPAMQADGTVQVAVTGVTAVVGPLAPSFTGPDGDELDALIEIGNSEFRAVISGLVQQQLIPTFTDKIPPILVQLLGAADKLLDGVNFTLDAGLGTAVTVDLASHIGALDIVPGPAVGIDPGRVAVREAVSIRPHRGRDTTNVAPVHTSRGAPRLDPLDPEPRVASDVQLVLHQELINALLHGLWSSGLLDGQATFGGLTAQVHTKLPPVVRPLPASTACTIDGVRCDIDVQLGQLEVTLPDFEQSFGINASAGARLVVDGSTIKLAIAPTPDLIVWETSAVHGTLSTGAISDIVQKLVWPMLFGALADKLSITIPLPDLAALGLADLAPGLANAQLALALRQRPDVTNGFVTLGAALQLSTPPPP